MTARSGALALVDRVPRPPEPERRQLTLSDLTGDTCSVEEAAEVLGVGEPSPTKWPGAPSCQACFGWEGSTA